MKRKATSVRAKHQIAPPSRRLFCLVVVCAGVSLTLWPALLHADDTWTGGGTATNTNWSNASNWNNGTPDTAPYGTLFFSTSTGSPSNDDIASLSENRLLYNAATGGFTINGTGAISLFDNGGTQAKIEANNTGVTGASTTGVFTLNNSTINFAATTGAAWGEINAVTNDITFGTANTLNVNGSKVAGIRLFGGNNRTTTFNNTVNATGKYFDTASSNAQIVTVGGSFTSGDFYLMNGSTLNDSSAGAGLAAANVRLGGDFSISGAQDLTKGATFNLTIAAGGQTYAGSINSVAGNTSGTLSVNSQNTSGTNTMSGGFFLDSNLAVNQKGNGGTLLIGAAASTNTVSFQNASNRTLTLGVTGATGTITVNEAFAKVADGSDVLITTGTAQGSTVTIAADNSASGANLLLFNPQSGTLAVSSASNLGSPTVSAGYPDKVLFGGNTTSNTATLAINGSFAYGSAVAGSLLGFAINKTSNTAGNTAILSTPTGVTFTMNGPISDFGAAANVGSFQKAGVGTVILTAPSSYTDSTVITAGTLAGTNANSFGSTTGISIASATSILSLRGDSSISFVKASDGTAYSVSTAASGATINVDQATSAGNGAKTMTIGTLGTTSTAAGNTFNFTGANNTSLSVGAMTGGASTAAATTTIANAIASPGTLTLASYTSKNTTGGENLTFSGVGSTVVMGTITQNTTPLYVTKSDVGSLTLSGNSTYAGASMTTSGNAAVVSVSLTAGTLIIGADSTSTDGTVTSGPLGTGALLIGSATVQGTNGAHTIANPIRYNGSVNIAGSTDLAFTGGVSNFATGTTAITVNNTGLTTFSGGALVGRADGTAAALRTLTLSGSGRINVDSAITSGTNDVAGTTTGTSFAYTGTSIVRSTGANTYNGTTTVGSATNAAGTLLINGTHTGGTNANSISQAYTVYGTLGGTGSISTNTTGTRTVTITTGTTAGGTLAPGDSTLATASQTGVFTINAPLVFSNTASIATTYAAQLGGNTAGNGAGHYDQVNVGALTLGTNTVLSLSLVNGYSPANNDILFLATQSGATAISGTFAGIAQGGTVTLPDGSTAMATYTANWIGTDFGSSLTGGNDFALYNFSTTPVPEPATWLAGSLLVGLTGFHLRRRSTKPRAKKECFAR